MPETKQEERFRWIKPILDKQIGTKELVRICPFSERTIKYWLSNYRKLGLDGLKDESKRPKSNSQETPIRIKERIIEMREKNRMCALKLKWNLEEENIFIHERTIGKILKNEKLTRRYRSRKENYKKEKVLFKEGDLIEIDVKYVPEKIKNRRYFQYTAID